MTNQAVKKANLEADSPPQDWHPSDVIAALHKAGWTMKALAEEHGLSSGSSLSKALTGSMPAGEKRIADALGLHPQQIWPTRYYENGEKKPRGFRGLKFNRFADGVNVKDKRVREHESA
ncbi:MAG: helix-turn-helix domain-containing protein [Methylicorpusculum sp.]|uniref:helix-turn-helix domain-containing protein n=1 Tax=Methylicorpusculum sp. TaxID=2713644 RepID=UPI002724B61D|nr:helix-turn-helix domain-containing protein [Methylicorpusculum sp.]MDO8940857.1 helix-turn-helix domain-containing protein [Methylicorpusculum sp.]MDP2202451.1 helix-turn-helix domain-containing protein [Methylicorpusculum sp.]